MEITDAKVLKILESVKAELNAAFALYNAKSKDDRIKSASGKIDTLIMLLQE